MPRVCTVCTHPDVRAIHESMVQTKSYRKVAERFELSCTSLYRHFQSHAAEFLSVATDAREMQIGRGLLEEVRSLHGHCLEILTEARANGRDRIALRAFREAARTLELAARLTGAGSVRDAEPDRRPIEVIYIDHEINQVTPRRLTADNENCR
jgi:hypothetical protein